ncbi:hypothetical protein MBLNU13_g00972t1 [Cladosporium sp. NU13]
MLPRSSSTATVLALAPVEPQQQSNKLGRGRRGAIPQGAEARGRLPCRYLRTHMYAQHEPSEERNSSMPMLPSFERVERVKLWQTAVPLDRAAVFTPPEREP